jgi:heat shock protein HtpX
LLFNRKFFGNWSYGLFFLIGIKNRKNRDKKIDWLAIVPLVWLQLSPAVVLFFIFQSQYSWVQHVLIIIASFVVGFKWTDSRVQTVGEFEKVILGEQEIKRTGKKVLNSTGETF